MKFLSLILVSVVFGSAAHASVKEEVLKKVLKTEAPQISKSILESSSPVLELKNSVRDAVKESRLVGQKVTSIAIKDDQNGIQIAVKAYPEQAIVINIEAVNLSESQIDSLAKALEKHGISSAKKGTGNHMYVNSTTLGKNLNHINILISTDTAKDMEELTRIRLTAAINEVSDFYTAVVKERTMMSPPILTRKSIASK